MCQKHSIGHSVSSSSNGNTLKNNPWWVTIYGFDDESIHYGTSEWKLHYHGQIPNEYFTNNVDASNTVNGKSIIYWVGQSDKAVPSDASCVILVNCTNITIQNQNLTSNSYGVQLAYTNNCTITGNNIQGDEIGIRLLSHLTTR